MWWQILDVPSDADLKAIKRAYARLIKEYRPDTHPSEFGDIRQAFEEARNWVKQRQTPQIDESHIEEQAVEASESIAFIPEQLDQLACETLEPDVEEYSDEPKHVSLTQNENTLEVESDSEALDHSERYAAMSQLVDEFGDLVFKWKAKKFNDEALLQDILHHEVLNQFESYQDVSEKLFSFLVDHIDLAKGNFTTSLNIPYQALSALDEIFDWSSSEVDILQKYDHEGASLVFYGIVEGHKNPKLVQRNWSPTKKNSLLLTRWIGYSIIFIIIVGIALYFSLLLSRAIGFTIPGSGFLIGWLLYASGKAAVRFFKKRSNKST